MANSPMDWSRWLLTILMDYIILFTGLNYS